MKAKLGVRLVPKPLLLLMLGVLAAPVPPAAAGPGGVQTGGPPGAGGYVLPPAKAGPYVVPLDQVRLEIVVITFPEKIQGVLGNVVEVKPELRGQLRLALVTLRVTKPAWTDLTVAAADLTLHYYSRDLVRGRVPQVALCLGLSCFTKTQEAERAVMTPLYHGPGRVRQATGARCQGATEVFIDVPFIVEMSADEFLLCVAQPATGVPYLNGRLGYTGER